MAARYSSRRAATRGSEAAPDGRRDRAGVRVLVHLDALDALDPLEPAAAGCDEPARRTVAVRERRIADVRGEQQVACVGEAEAPAVARVRDHPHVAGAGLDAGLVEQPAEPDAAPWL